MDKSKVIQKKKGTIVGKTIPFYGTFFLCEKKFVNQKRVELNFCNASCYNYTIYACLLNL